VNAHEVKAGIGVIAGNTVWSMPERLECEVLQKARYINVRYLLTYFDYRIRGPMQKRLYNTLVRDISDLKQSLIDTWASISQNVNRESGYTQGWRRKDTTLVYK